MAKLKQTSQVALQIISELSSTTPKNPSQSQNKADRAFEGVLACIDTAAQATIGSSRRSYLIFHLDSNKQHFFSWLFYEKREFADSQKETSATKRTLTRDSKTIR